MRISWSELYYLNFFTTKISIGHFHENNNNNKEWKKGNSNGTRRKLELYAAVQKSKKLEQ